MGKRGRAGDDLPSFDEGFVSSGPVELSATQRAIAAAREEAAVRAKALRDEQFYGASGGAAGGPGGPGGPKRRRNIGRRIKGRLNRVAQIVVVVAAVAAAVWWVASRPSHHHPSQPAATVAPAGPAGVKVATGETTTTLLGLGNFGYAPGACVTWDQTAVGEANTSQVPCSQSHLVEVVAPPFQVSGFGSAFPGETTLSSFYQKQCTGPAEKFLGYALDPAGRFDADAVGPSPAGWVQGDRTAACTLQLSSGSGVLIPLTGEIRGANQEQLYPAGSCGSRAVSPIACTALHSWQVTGNVNLAGRSTYPATDAAMQAAVGTTCGHLGLAFVGGTYPAGVQSGWLELSATSWADGERTVQCIVSTYAANGTTELSTKGSLAKTRS